VVEGFDSRLKSTTVVSATQKIRTATAREVVKSRRPWVTAERLRMQMKIGRGRM
jgi:hypothetical protein